MCEAARAPVEVAEARGEGRRVVEAAVEDAVDVADVDDVLTAVVDLVAGAVVGVVAVWKGVSYAI